VADAASGESAVSGDSASAGGNGVVGAVPRTGRILGWFGGTALLVLAADILTKVLAVDALQGREPLRLLGGAVYLVLTRNSGAAWGLGAGYTIVLTVVAVVVIAVIIRFVRRLASTPWAVTLGLILGGATGNLMDRLFRAPGPLRGAVVDFVSVFDDSGDVWPVFNVADSALVIGVLMALALELAGRRFDGSRAKVPSPGRDASRESAPSVRHSQGDDSDG
jgi:signal peptidase II